MIEPLLATTAPHLAVLVAAGLVGGLIRGYAGFGFALAAVPVLSIVISHPPAPSSPRRRGPIRPTASGTTREDSCKAGPSMAPRLREGNGMGPAARIPETRYRFVSLAILSVVATITLASALLGGG